LLWEGRELSAETFFAFFASLAICFFFSFISAFFFSSFSRFISTMLRE
jgi:hypothetical protein